MQSDARQVLVVINDPERRERVVHILAADGFLVTATAEGLAALRAIAMQSYGLIVAGLDLPGSLDGLATVRRARQRQPWLKALYTAPAASRPAGGNPDTEDFIAEPFERWELLGCAFELLQREMAVSQAADLVRRMRVELRAS